MQKSYSTFELNLLLNLRHLFISKINSFRQIDRHFQGEREKKEKKILNKKTEMK
jgi:hypothetical protein